MKEKKHIWLLGENVGNTANNNSFYFWQHVVNKEDEVSKYFVMSKNRMNKKVYGKLNKNEKKYVVWKDSLKHHLLYKDASLLFVTLSYKDVEPTRIFIKRGVNVPVIYLQHGTLAIKKIGYNGKSYNNNMFRFFYYNRYIKDVLKKENDFSDYQLYYAEFHPRYKELIRKTEEYKKDPNTKKILWFITWREYFGDNKETEKFIENIKSVINNYKMNEYLQNENAQFKICLHQFFDKEKINYLTNKLKNENIKIVTPDKIDVMDEVVKNDILITDYSSIAFDFTMLNKPVFLYQPDISIYSKYREFYYLDEMKKYSIKTPSKLVNELIEKQDSVNEFFRSKLPENIDYEYIKQGKHIDKIYDEYYNMQLNEITFFGYNFYGTGGTVSATLALAEGLLEKKYLVKLISLKKTKIKSDLPNGLNVTAFYARKRNLQYYFKKFLFLNQKHFKYFKYDNNTKYLIPYVGWALENKLNKIKSKTVVSTRETIHLFLKNAKNENIRNKVYFFHTFYGTVKQQFNGLIDELAKKENEIEKAVFVTELGKIQYEEKASYSNYKECEIINNCIESKKMIERDEIIPIKRKNRYNSVYMLRISKDRIKDIENLLNFAKYMKEKKFNKLVIHVYGVGDYLEEFLETIEKEQLEKYIKYEGLATNIKEELKKYDAVTDFSLNHSFGMTYLEAIFNGKMIFGMINQGSKMVLSEMPYCYINSYDDLIEKIKKLDQIKIDDLQKNYDIMYSKYSRDVVTNKFIKYIDDEGKKENEEE